MEYLKELSEKLEHALHDRLVSVILYGSGVVHDQFDKFSDLNILCVLKDVTPRELAECEPVFRWWTSLGNPSPVLMSEEEVHHSADSFAIEFHDIRERRRVLYGLDLIKDVHVDMKYHRVQLEHELRSKQLRIRQQGARVLSNPEALLRLCLDSVTTFAALGRHALIAAGIHPKTDRRGVIWQLAHTVPLDASPFEVLLNIREDKSLDSTKAEQMGDPGELFARYLDAIRQLVEYVDGLEK